MTAKKATSKCDYCGKEELLPFNCPFCYGKFCGDHRLPENHSCRNLPPPKPLGSYKLKKNPPERPLMPINERTVDTKRICPKCGSKRTMISAVRKEFDLFLCLDCKHKWKTNEIKKGKKETHREMKTKLKISHKNKLRIGYIICLIVAIILTLIGFPFTVKYTSTEVPFMGEYQLHSIIFLGSPLFSWDTWNASLGTFDLFISFILNFVFCFVIFKLLKRF